MVTNPQEMEILDHLGYEWWMFRSTWSALSKMPANGDFVRNALLESLIIHARAMIDFFQAKTPDASDWTVDKLGRGLCRHALQDDVSKWRKEANKRIAHMTDWRAKPLSEWDVELIFQYLEPKVADVRRIFGVDFPENWVGENPRCSAYLGTILPSNLHQKIGPTGHSSPLKRDASS